MIKSLFGEDGPPSPKTEKLEAETEDEIKKQLDELNLAAVDTENSRSAPADAPDREFEQAFSRVFGESATTDETTTAAAATENDERRARAAIQFSTPPFADEDDAPLLEIDEELVTDAPFPVEARQQQQDSPSNRSSAAAEAAHENFSSIPTFYINQPTEALPGATKETAVAAAAEPFQSAAGSNKSLTTAETIRQSGMAWSAAVGLFGSILFMMILGWFFDVLTGASPWGLVGGIIIGGGLGFYQFFRVTSQIFK